MLDALPVQKEMMHCHKICLLFVQRKLRSQKEDENVESCTRVNAHTRGKQNFFCTLILLQWDFFNMLLLVTSYLLWKRTLFSKTKCEKFPGLSYDYV